MDHPSGPLSGVGFSAFFFFVYSSILGDIRLWVGPRIEHPLSSWDLTLSLIIAPKPGDAWSEGVSILESLQGQGCRVLFSLLIDSGLFGSTDRLGGVPTEQKMLKGHLPRVIHHQVY